MKRVKTTVSKKKVEDYSGDLLVSFVWLNKKKGLVVEEGVRPFLSRLQELEEFTAGKSEHILFYPNIDGGSKKIKCRRLLLIGLDKIDHGFSNYDEHEFLRTIGGDIAGLCRRKKVQKISVSLHGLPGNIDEIVAEYVTEGVILGNYQFLKYKQEKKDDGFAGLDMLEFRVDQHVTGIRRGIARAVGGAMAASLARDMANEPGNFWTAAHFAKQAQRMAETNDLKCTILNKSAMKKLGMGGILSVNKGSKEAPKCIILDHNPKGKKATVLLVGKGLTFDSGGVNLKPAAGMMEMKYDMCGGAAVMATMEVVARENPKLRIVAIVPATDNMAGGGALKPGDIITHYGGITSEIENTDAEGRLILADALAYGCEKYQPDCVVDLATLTGSVIIGLGHHYTGLMGNDDRLIEQLLEAGNRSGEPLWRLPLGSHYAKQIDSKIADIKNIGGRAGGCITAAEYLKKFIGDTPWAHLDIAGTAWDFTEKSYIPKGPSGIGVRTLISFIRNYTPDKATTSAAI